MEASVAPDGPGEVELPADAGSEPCAASFEEFTAAILSALRDGSPGTAWRGRFQEADAEAPISPSEAGEGAAAG